MKDLSVDGGQLSLSDARPGAQARAQPVRVELTALRAAAQNLAFPEQRGAAPAKLQLSVRVAAPAALPAAARTPPSQRDAGGLIDWKGQVATSPLLARGALRIERFPLHLFEPYFADKLNLSLLRAEAGYRGDLSVQEGASGLSVSAVGDVLLADVQVHNRQVAASAVAATAGFAGTDELLSWQSLALKGLKLAVQPGAGPQVEVGEAALSDFYARLVVTEQGRLNLQDVAGPATAASAAAAGVGAGTASASASASASAASGVAVIVPSNPQPAGLAGVQADTPTGAQAEKPTGAQAGTPVGAAAGPPLTISVGSTRLANGTVDFNDRFVRPNYSAKLTGLNGQLGAFRSGTRDMATLELRGRVAGTALLDISGQLNPTADPLALDIKAKATDLELAPLSPYAGKYAGYAIERGKLSMEVAYKISPDGKLEASNQVILNQLTFGDKIDSPDATKLPVLLAVALLKDRHGVIDINLPVSGSLNDPQFSVGGIIIKVIINLLTKAFTAPFALLAGGGGSDDLSLVEFKPGTSVLTASGASAVEKVAKSLADRPALKMTVTGAADPVSERADYQRAALEARLTAERRREALRDGAAADAPVVMSAEDRVRLLTELYRQTDMPGKPRNAIGMLRDIPGPEMEALLLPRTLVSAEVMRELALQRGLAVRDGLVAKGLPSERLFLAAPKLRASGEDEAAWTPRVQLALSVN